MSDQGPLGEAREVFQTNFAFGRAVRLQAQNVHPGYWQSAHPDEEGYLARRPLFSQAGLTPPWEQG